MSSAAIVQSCYLPWKGYFHLIRSVDHFVFLDGVQYTRRDWRNRNLIKTRDGLQWLSVPVHARRGMLIRDVRIAGQHWQKKHLESLQHAYGKCPCFGRYADFLHEVYEHRRWEYLSELNQYTTRSICGFLGIDTLLHADTEFAAPQEKNRRLLHILQSLGATRYVSGPSARAYLDVELYRREGVEVQFFAYPDYPAYPQLHGPFCHQVSILDLLFNVGDERPRHIWGAPDDTV